MSTSGQRTPTDQRVARWLGCVVQGVSNWWRRHDYAPNSLGATYLMVYRAVQTKRLVHAGLHGHSILFCPHVLGLRHAEPFVLGYQVSGMFAQRGEGDADAPLRGWRWIRLGDLREARLVPGAWSPDASAAPPVDALQVHIRAR